MRKRAWTIVVVGVLATVTAVVAAPGGPPRVGLIGRAPVITAGKTWHARLRAPAAPLVLARKSGRTLSFRTVRIGSHRFRAAIRLPAAGRWTLTARVGRKRYGLGSVRVVAGVYLLDSPAQLVANPDGSLLVAERGTRNRVTRIDPVTGQVSPFSSIPGEPYGLAWQGNRLLVTSRAGIFAVPAHGGRAQRLNTAQVGPLVPEGASTALYGGETELGRIELTTGVTHPFTTSVANPHTLILTDPGRLLVTDTTNDRVLSVDTATGSATTIASGLHLPIPMAIGPTGDLIVAEHESGRLLRLNGDGSTSVLATGLRKPYSMVATGDGNYYVAEVGELRVATGKLRRVTQAGRVTTVRLHK